MNSIPIYIRYSDRNVVLDKVADLTQENNLVYNHEGPFKTTMKFALLTLASPLITLARLVRSAVFFLAGDGDRGGREFVGALFAQLFSIGCFVGSLLSSLVYIISAGGHSFHGSMRRTYAYFEAWVGGIHLQSRDLPSYSRRASSAFDWTSKGVWTTAPCMQPMLERGEARQGGLLDPERMQRIFPFIRVNDVVKEGDTIVIQSEYENEHVHYVACGGLYEHQKITNDFCCCYRVESVYDRVLCCEVGKGTCTSTANHGDHCGIVGCGACGVGVCCCYAQDNHQLTAVNTGCFGPQGLSCVTGIQRIA